MHLRESMHQKAWQLQQRTDRFVSAVKELVVQVPDNAGALRIGRGLLTTSQAMLTGYRDASASSSPESFIAGISSVARNAKKARVALLLLVQLNHVSIEAAREVILEARGLEAIFLASRNTSRKRHRARTRAAERTDGG